MKSFKDTEGREWMISLNVTTIKRVRDLCGIDLLQSFGSAALEKLASDPIMLCDLLFVLCRDDAEKRNVSDEDFGMALGGDALNDATTAFLAELVNFTPNPRRREILQKAFAKMQEVESAMMNYAEARLAALDAETTAKTLGEQSIASPESSE